VTTLREEKEINTFLRLGSPSVIAALREAFPDLPEKPDPKTAEADKKAAPPKTTVKKPKKIAAKEDESGEKKE